MSRRVEKSAGALETGVLIAVDWGTSNFRAALLDGRGIPVSRFTAEHGVKRIGGRQFRAVFRELLAAWLPACPRAPVVMSGMIGSVDGLLEADYVDCPAGMGDVARRLVRAPGLDDTRPVFIVPGLRGRSVSGDPDVMRGEEVQIFGALDLDARGELLFCLPGTHTKWARVEGARVLGFSTSMTGELFALLREHSVLSRFAGQGRDDAQSFDRGLLRARDSGGLLHQLFGVRAAVLAGELAAQSSASYLSGLLIGAEVAAMLGALAPKVAVRLVGSPALTTLYERALRHFGQTWRTLDGDAAAARGLYKIALQAGLVAPDSVTGG